MKNEQIKEFIIRPIKKNEPIPYELLLDADPSREIVDKYLTISDMYITLLNNEIIGEYVLCPISVDVAEIKNISVAEVQQGRGFGRLMLYHAFEKAKEKSFKIIVIGTGNVSFGPLHLYQKVGFELTGIKNNFFVDNYPAPIYENGIQVKHMIMLEKKL